MIRVTFFSESSTGACHKYRVTHPMEALDALPNYRVRYSEKWEPQIKGDNLFWFQRNGTKEAMQVQYQLVKSGRNVIYDMDDDILHILETNPVYNLYFHQPHIPWHQLMGIRYATLCTVTCEGLKRLYSPINPRIRVLPNCIKVEEWENVEPILKETDAVRIFWGGSPTHRGDLGLVSDALVEVKRKYGDAVEIIIMGEVVDIGTEVTFIPFGPYDFFQRVMLSCHIGIAPMKDVLFNHGKSDLRLKELGASGLAIVASAVGEYNQPKMGALLCENTEDWISALSKLLQDSDTRNQRAKQAKEWAWSWDIKNHIHLWTSVIEELVGDSTRRSPGETIRIQTGKRPTREAVGNKIRVGTNS